jgi:polyhydroxyalkanoate synthesis repressor PhaR
MKLIKRYPNRRLYDTDVKSYITLSNIRDYIKTYQQFEIVDSKSGKDLTRHFLLQVLTEIESEGHASVLTNKMLEEIVRFYDTKMSGILGQHIEQSILAFIDHQRRWQDETKKFNELNPVKAFNDFFQNMAPNPPKGD